MRPLDPFRSRAIKYPPWSTLGLFKKTAKASAVVVVVEPVEWESSPQNTDPPRGPHRVPKLIPPPIPTGTPTHPRGAPKLYNSMKNVHKYQAHPWGREVWFTQDEQTLRKLCKRFGLDPDTTGSNGLCWDHGPTLVIWVRPGQGTDVLVHECCHAALGILDYAGMNPARANGEPMCYTLQRMVAAFLPHLIPQNS